MMRRLVGLIVALVLLMPGMAAATVGTTTNSTTAQGNGATTSFTYAFPIPVASDAVVIYTDTTGASTTLTPTQYTITGIGVATGGTVTYPLSGSPIASGTTLTIERIVPYTQTVSISSQGPTFRAIENALDGLTYQTQQLNASIGRSIQIPLVDPLTINTILPAAAQRANLFVGFDASGNVIASGGSSGVPISAAMTPVVQATTLALGRAAFGLGTAAVLNTGTTAGTIPLLQSNGGNIGFAALDGSLLTNLPITVSIYPEGRLTLTSGKPVMIADATAQNTVYYDCYTGNKVPIYNGSSVSAVPITSCEVSVGLDAGVPHVALGSLYDIFAVNSSGAVALCVGPSWGAGGGSTTARGTGAGSTAIHNTTTGFWTNTNALTNCWGGASGTTNLGTVAVDQGTYLGTLYGTANGQTGMAFKPNAASGGTNNILALSNGYNRVQVFSVSKDSTSSWTYATAAWRAMNASNSNRVTWVDGLAQGAVRATNTVAASESTATGVTGLWGVAVDSSTATPTQVGRAPPIGGATYVSASGSDIFSPLLGVHYIQAIEYATGATVTFVGGDTGSNGQALTVEVSM